MAPQRTISVQYIRVLSMISIIICHFLQSIDIKYAWIFNIGVQVFLSLSGYLYGKKNISDWNNFFIGRFHKICIPYLIYVIIVLVLYDFFISDLTWKNYACYLLGIQAVCGGVNGLQHLWFITAILLCYLTVPVLQILRKYSDICLLIISVVAIIEYSIVQKLVFQFSWFFLFTSSYFYSSSKTKTKILFLTLVFFVAIYSFIIITWDDIQDLKSMINRIFHDSIGLLIVIGLSPMIDYLFKKPKQFKVLDWIDKNSYALYLVHHIYLLGPISLISVTPFLPLNISVIIILMILSSILLNFITHNIKI